MQVKEVAAADHQEAVERAQNFLLDIPAPIKIEIVPKADGTFTVRATYA